MEVRIKINRVGQIGKFPKILYTVRKVFKIIVKLPCKVCFL